MKTLMFSRIPRRAFAWIVLVFFVVAATFAAWSDSYLSMKGRERDLHGKELELLSVRKSSASGSSSIVVLPAPVVVTQPHMLSNAAPSPDPLEDIAGKWYHVGFACGQADMLKSLGKPIVSAEAPCAKWDARFRRGGGK